MVILMPTCDTHVAAAEASGKLLRRYWPDHPPLYVVHYSKKPRIDADAFIRPGDGDSWLEAVRLAAEQIHDPFILLLLDDYGLCAAAKLDRIYVGWRRMFNDPSIGLFALSWYPSQQRLALGENLVELIKSPVLLQAAIWRRDWLLDLANAVGGKSSPWGFEHQATQAVYRRGMGRRMLADDFPQPCRAGSLLVDGLDKAHWPLPYHNLMDRGCWSDRHVPFLIREGIAVPSRGFGDTIAKVAHSLGVDCIAKKVQQVIGIPCGCGDRQEKLNAAVPYELAAAVRSPIEGGSGGDKLA